MLKSKTAQLVEGLLVNGVFLKFDPPTAAPTAASLNAALAGAKKQHIHVYAKGADSLSGETQQWFNATLTLTGTETCTDAQIGIPVVPATIAMVNGKAEFDMVYDTDANVAKTYAAGDFVEVTISAITKYTIVCDVTEVFTATVPA